MNPPADKAEPKPSAAGDVTKLASEPTKRDANSWLNRNRNKLATAVGIVALAGFGLNAIFNRVPDTKPAQEPEAKEAHDAGIVYGSKAGEMARANGKAASSLTDGDVDQMRTLLTGTNYDSKREQFNSGFKEGYFDGKPSPSNEAVKLSKAQWKVKLADKYGALVDMGTIAGWDKAGFQQLMGAPSKTQTVEGTAFWYFECSDGTIQLELNSGALAAGLMQGKINDY